MKSKSVILDIFNGFKGHRETMNLPKPEFKKNLGVACDTMDKLKEILTPELFSLVEKCWDNLSQHYCMEIDFYYKEGFKLGLLIGIESAEN